MKDALNTPGKKKKKPVLAKKDSDQLLGPVIEEVKVEETKTEDESPAKMGNL